MGEEGELERAIQAAKFRDDMFLHAIANQNAKLYVGLYETEEPSEDEWEIPQTPEDVQAMLAELAQVGIELST